MTAVSRFCGRYAAALILVCLFCIGAAGAVYAAPATPDIQTEGGFFASDEGNRQAGSPEGRKHVLLLFSYTLAWDGENDIYMGFRDAFRDQVDCDYVFMDCKNLNADLAYRITEEYVDNLFEKNSYDAIICVDDNALDYVMEYRQSRFPEIPVIFNNINSLGRAQNAAKDHLSTGIVESFFSTQTVELAHRLFPETKKVIGIGDHSLTGNGMEVQFKMTAKQFPELSFQFLDMTRYSRAQIKKMFSSYGEDTLLLYLNFTQDGDGNRYSLAESIDCLRSVTKLPLLKPDAAGIGKGILGGYGGSYYDVGVDTAGILKKVLRGIPPSSIRVTSMTGHYIFDHALLSAYGLRESDLPVGTEYVNGYKPFWQEYADQLRPAILAFVLLAVIIALLLGDRKRIADLIKSKKSLSDEEIRRRQAEDRSDAATQFLSSVSHDIRTPLNGVIGYTDLSLKTDDPEKRQEYLEKIWLSGSLLDSIVNDTLDVSRMISGKSRLWLETTTMKAVMDPVIASVQIKAKDRGIHFVCDIQQPELGIRVDRTKLQKMVMNLLTNALNYTPKEGSVSLTSEYLLHEEDEMNVLITVADTGIGMSPEFQKVMFQPFMQEQKNGTDMRGVSGTGLGLTIVKNTVDLMGGTIQVTSRKGSGTRIMIRLALEIAGNLSDPSEKSKDGPKDYSILAGKKVLIVEDNAMNMEIMITLLRREKISVACALNGAEAVNQFKASKPGDIDAILMDLRMPVMDGYEAAKQIRAMARPDALTVPILAMTADTYEEDARKCLDAGMNGHISKPINPGILFDQLVSNISAGTRNL